jgi:hypothetical protein
MRRTRRDTRYLLSRPWEGTLRVPGDVIIERHDGAQRELWVTSPLSVRRDEVLTLHLAQSERSLVVRVVESRPVMIDGAVRHRLRLEIVQ